MRNDSQLSVTVYSTPGCVQCKLSRTWLDKHDVPYVEVDLSEDQDALEMVRNLGYQAAPVIVASKQYEGASAHWSGFIPANLEWLIAEEVA